MAIGTVSSQNQITLPRAITRSLGIMPSDKVYVRQERERIIVEPLKKSVVDDTYGVLRDKIAPRKRGKSMKEIVAKTKKIVAEKLAAEGTSDVPD